MAVDKLKQVLNGFVLSFAISSNPLALELPFEVAKVKYHKVPQQQILDGKVEAVSQTTVSAQTSGRIEEILYDIDDYVPKGQLIVRIRDTTQRAAVAQTNAVLTEARARLGEMRSDHERAKKLFAKGLVSQAELDKARGALDAARARFDAARAKLAEAKERLAHTVVRAPYSGIVTKRHMEVGETAKVGTPLMTGLSLERLRVAVNVPQRQIEAVRTAAVAQVRLDSGENIESTDLVFFPYADPASNTFTVRVNLQRAVRGLFPGMFVKVAFITGEQSRLLVPIQAVVFRSELTGVYVVSEDGRVSLRQVRLGHRFPGMVEVLAGLEAGEQIALDTVAAGIYLKSGKS